MNKKYENPEILFLWLKNDFLTMSGDNDSPFDGVDDDERNWGQYY